MGKPYALYAGFITPNASWIYATHSTERATHEVTALQLDDACLAQHLLPNSNLPY